MRLPDAERRLVERDKVVNYLMNPRHPEEAGKAAFFFSLGFRLEEWQALADGLLRVASDGIVTQVVGSAHGSKYTVVAPLRTPNNKTVLVRTVWIKESGRDRPRLVTAYPKEG
jgi:hypothetical protein